MQEDIQKNFILLSKVAKEKKYAQEYLGLLARRGDIGSIRIGKRWYTTWAWFEEFLENGLKKKIESIPEVQEIGFEKVKQIAVSEKIATDGIKINLPAEVIAEEVPVLSAVEKEEVKINVPLIFPEREKVLVGHPVTSIERKETVPKVREKVAVAVEANRDQIIIRKNILVEKRKVAMPGLPFRPVKASVRNFVPVKRVQPILQDELKLRNTAVAERNRYAVPYKEIKLKKKEDVFSPNLAAEARMDAPLFSRFAFALSFAVILLLVAASGYFVWSGGLLARGQVAGASDERNAVFSGITSGGGYVLTSAGDKMKESLSISRVIVQAAKEKSTNEASAQPEEDAKAVLITN